MEHDPKGGAEARVTHDHKNGKVVMFSRLFPSRKLPEPVAGVIQVGTRAVPLLMVRHPRARRYLLRLRPDGTVRVTIPRRGTQAEARQFAMRHVPWLEQQFLRLAARPTTPVEWHPGTKILFRGESVRIGMDEDGGISFGSDRVAVSGNETNLRPAIEKHLRQMASRELPERVMELAGLHGVSVTRVTVRNQKSRWGSCSRRGTISLNWRLVQAPAHVRDYVILHELAHRRHMNHSDRFWQEVARLCPEHVQAERWLKERTGLLRTG